MILRKRPTAAIVSYRLNFVDGVSTEADKWREVLTHLGYRVVLVAGNDAPGVTKVPGLALRATEWTHEDSRAISRILDGVALTVVENVFSTSWRPNATQALARLLKGRPAIIKHHDVAWGRVGQDQSWEVPDDPEWRHVSINRMNAEKLADHGINAKVFYNAFRPVESKAAGQRSKVRLQLGIGETDLLLLQPTRLSHRKNVEGGIRFAASLQKRLPERVVRYWITGPNGLDFDEHLQGVLDAAEVPVIRGPVDTSSPASAYSACDVVMFPSYEEGFGNPVVESAMYRRPLVVDHYPVLDELAAFGFKWFDIRNQEELGGWLEQPNVATLDHNAKCAAFFNLEALEQRLSHLLLELGAPVKAKAALKSLDDGPECFSLIPQ